MKSVLLLSHFLKHISAELTKTCTKRGKDYNDQISYTQKTTKDCDIYISQYTSRSNSDGSQQGSGGLYCLLKSEDIVSECIFPSCPSGYESKISYPGSDRVNEGLGW